MEISFSEFMLGMVNAPFDHNVCDKCGGLGAEPVMCCDGRECGCRGMPVDFRKCNSCKSIIPSDHIIKSYIPKELK